MGNSSNEKNNSKAIIIVLAVSIIISLIIVCVSVVYVIKGNSKENASGYDYSYSANNDLYQSTEDDLDQYLGDDVATEQFSEQASSYGNGTGVNNNKATSQNSAVAYYESFSKNGDNKLSDNYDNTYIKLVSAEYGVDTDLLVAIYSVPDTGNNFVLEFNGTKDSNGNIIKSPDTLKKVYQIDKDRNIKVATSSGVGNVDVSYAEGILCFSMVKTIVMAQYPDYFTGID